MILKDFYAIIDSEKALEESMIPSLSELVKKYPFFQVGIFLYIKCLYISNSDSFSSELNRLSAFIHNRDALFYYVMDNIYKQFHQRTKNPIGNDRTNLLINAFFETQEDNNLDIYIEQALSNSNTVSSDYFSNIDVLTASLSDKKEKFEDEDELELLDDDIEHEFLSKSTIYRITESNDENKSEVTLKHQNLIDNFLSKTEDFDNIRIKIDDPVNTQMEEYVEDEDNNESEAELDDDLFFTQTLANIYIKQKKFERAYEIIKRLSLNYPEKNSYFADQLSFLEKAIINLKK